MRHRISTLTRADFDRLRQALPAHAKVRAENPARLTLSVEGLMPDDLTALNAAGITILTETRYDHEGTV